MANEKSSPDLHGLGDLNQPGKSNGLRESNDLEKSIGSHGSNGSDNPNGSCNSNGSHNESIPRSLNGSGRSNGSRNSKSTFSAKGSGGSDSSRNPNRSRNSNGSHSAKGSGASNSSRNSKGSGVTNSSHNSKNSGNSNGSHNANGSSSANSSSNSKNQGNGTGSRSAKGSDSSNSPQSANGLQNIGDAHDTNKAPKSGNSAVLSAQRESGRKEYSDPIKVEQKWLREYGHMTKDEDSYEVNKSCITEVFNMLDYVAENKIYEFCADAEDISEEDAGLTRKIRKNGQEYTFEKPNQKFYSQIKTLQIFGFNISNDVIEDVRIKRNVASHGTQTIVQQVYKVGYEETKECLLIMADALIALGMLSPELREPPFEKLRVREGGTLHNDYVIGEQIGEGGTSRVYKSSQKRTGIPLAIKELKPGSYSEDTFKNECSVMTQLRNDRIPRIWDVFFENGTYYLVMEHVEGQTLESYCAKRNLSREQKMRLALEICEALQYLHNKEILHADLKPKNILVDKNGDIHLIDFGISRGVYSANVLGLTPEYAAPEVCSGKPGDYRSDIYSYGKVLNYIFSANAEAEEMPEGIQKIIDICTMHNPENRYVFIQDVGEELRRAAAEIETSKAPASEDNSTKLESLEQMDQANVSYEKEQANAEKNKQNKNVRKMIPLFVFLAAGVIVLFVIISLNRQQTVSETINDSEKTLSETEKQEEISDEDSSTKYINGTIYSGLPHYKPNYEQKNIIIEGTIHNGTTQTWKGEYRLNLIFVLQDGSRIPCYLVVEAPKDGIASGNEYDFKKSLSFKELNLPEDCQIDRIEKNGR